EADHIAMDYGHWRIDRVFLLVPAQEYVGKFLSTFKEFPPSQEVGSFSLDQVMKQLSAPPGGGN
ncbi:MAG: arylsulfatase, partial [Gammaproteobacteria bacterium]|nr:arylsulfatase [Gammaproteobacteria bacterium]